MSLILCIESGTEVCSVALAQDGQLLSLRESLQGREHATNMGIYIDDIIKGNDVDLRDIDAVAVSMGPGSYTGLRIGVSMAKGICYGAKIPLITVNSLESLTNVAIEDYQAGIISDDDFERKVLCPMIDARRMEVYMQNYSYDMQPLSEVEAYVVTAESFAEEAASNGMVIFGDGAIKVKEMLSADNVSFVSVASSARGLIKSAFRNFHKKKFADLAYFEPYYLKDFVATTSSKRFF